MAIKENRAVFLLLLFSIFLVSSRVYHLGSKPYHHDEAQYAMESWKYSRPNGDYQFNPILHGPFLYHMQSALFRILPANDFTGRLPVLISGILFVLVGAWALRRKGWETVTTFVGFCTFSPVFCYFSRFLGMDLVMVLLATLALASFLEYLQTGTSEWLLAFSLFFAWMACTKLNFLFYAFAGVTFAVIYDTHVNHALSKGAWNWVKSHRFDFFGSILLFAFIFCSLYSSMFRHPEGILDALYRKMLPYWIEQNRLQRIKGPFHYYLPFLAIYELPLLLGLGFSFLKIIRWREKTFWKGILGIIVLWILLRSNWNSLFGFASHTLHMERAFHPPLLLIYGILWWKGLKTHLQENKPLEAFLLHWGFVSLVLYSYAGEKIPWLLPHILLPWVFYLSLVLPRRLHSALETPIQRYVLGSFLILAISWQAVITLRASWMLSADPRERLVYTHTSPDMLDFVRRIERYSKNSAEGLDVNMQVVGGAGWPLYWYFRNYSHWFSFEVDLGRKPEILVVDWEERGKLPKEMEQNYTMEQLKLREWWLCETNKATFIDYIRYYFTRQPFSILGHQDVAVYVRNDVLRFWY